MTEFLWAVVISACVAVFATFVVLGIIQRWRDRARLS